MRRGDAVDDRGRRFITRGAKLGGRAIALQDRETDEGHYLLKLRTT